MEMNKKYGITDVSVGSIDSSIQDGKLRVEWAGDVGDGVIEIERGNEDNDYKIVIRGNEIEKDLIKEILNKVVDVSEVEYRLLDTRLF